MIAIVAIRARTLVDEGGGRGDDVVDPVPEVVRVARCGDGPERSLDRLPELDVVRPFLRQRVGGRHGADGVVGDQLHLGPTLVPRDAQLVAEPAIAAARSSTTMPVCQRSALSERARRSCPNRACTMARSRSIRTLVPLPFIGISSSSKNRTCFGTL